MKQEDFAKTVGVSKNTYARYEREETFPDNPFLAKMCSKLGVNANWLLLGEGPVYAQDLVAGRCLDADQYSLIPLLESKVTAGPEGEIVYDEVSDYLPFKRWWVEKLVGKGDEHAKALILTKVRGDSMVPTINPGEIALVDTHENERIKIIDGKLYLILQPDGTVALKRVVLSSEANQLKLVCMSDNTTGFYRTYYIMIEPSKRLTHYILGRLRWAGKEFD
jgi:transcriptional regulator with XRE-family HTH domain